MPGRVPLIDAAISYDIMRKYPGKRFDEDDIKAQVEFWHYAGYDYIALNEGMMQRGKSQKTHIFQRSLKKNSWKMKRTSGILKTARLSIKGRILYFSHG